MSDTDTPTLTVTPDIWRLGPLGPSARKYCHYGIHLDGEYAVGTDGDMLVAIHHRGPSMPPTWRIEFLHPVKLRWDDQVAVPMALGLHAAERKGGGVSIVRISDVSVPYPDWRAVRAEAEKLHRTAPVGVGLAAVARFGAVLGEGQVLRLSPVERQPLAGLTCSPGEGVFALLMPCRIDR